MRERNQKEYIDMDVVVLEFSEVSEGVWESEPFVAIGGDIRIRTIKKAEFPIYLLVSIDGVEEYIVQDSFGAGEKVSEVSVSGAVSRQHFKLRTSSELELIKVLQ